MHEVMHHIREHCLPGYEFRGMPELTLPPEEDVEDPYSEDEY